MPKAHCCKAIDRCHRDAGHQGCDWTWTLVEAQKEDPELGAAITRLKTDFPKECGWTECLAKLKQLMGPAKDTLDGRAVLRTTDKLTLSGRVLYQRHHLEDVHDVIKRLSYPEHIAGRRLTDAIEMQDIKDVIGHGHWWKTDSGGLEHVRMWCKPLRTAKGETPTRGKIHGHLWCQLLLLPPCR